MNADIKEKWIAALRSGKYKQGNSYLRRGDEYCCLGVLCDVMGMEWSLNASSYSTPSMTEVYQCGDNDLSYPSQTTLELAGIGPNDLNVKVSECDKYTRTYNLWQLNDSLRYSFNRIADIIEEQL
jgi:hypothetical protein